MVIYRLILSFTCLLLFLSTSTMAAPAGEPRYLRLYMTDMHGWGEIRDMNMLAGDTLFISLIVEDAAGNPIQGARLNAQSAQGNRITASQGLSDENGWFHADIIATQLGEDRVRFRVGEINVDLKLNVYGDEAEMPAVQGQLGSSQALVVDYPGALPWETLADITPGKNFGPPSFGDRISAYDGQQVILQGFMLPLENDERQGHFILSANPPHCFFCMPGGAESMVEVFASPGIHFNYDPVTITGTLHLMRSDEAMGLYYRLNGARLLQ